MDDYDKQVQDRKDGNIPTDDCGRTFHEQDEDGAIGCFIIICLIVVGVLVWKFLF